MGKQYFTNKYIEFFKKLSLNNNREWFKENKAAFEEQVRQPFIEFVTDLIAEINKVEKNPLSTSAQEYIFRINKDVRFSKDKLPYKVNMSAAITTHGRNPEYPGIYIELGNDGVIEIAGLYSVSTENLHKIRRAISKDVSSFKRLVSSKNFKECYRMLEGDISKIVPSEFKLIASKEPLIKHKQYYGVAKFPKSFITSASLLSTVTKHYAAALPLIAFLRKEL